MADFLKTYQDNNPGIAELEYVIKPEVQSIADAVDGVIASTDIVLKTGKVWSSIEFTERSASMETKEQESAAGKLYVTSGKLKIPKDGSTFSLNLKKLSHHDLVFRETDNNGVVRIIGSLNAPATLNYIASKPSSGFNGYEVEISCSDIEPPVYVED